MRTTTCRSQSIRRATQEGTSCTTMLSREKGDTSLRRVNNGVISRDRGGFGKETRLPWLLPKMRGMTDYRAGIDEVFAGQCPGCPRIYPSSPAIRI